MSPLVSYTVRGEGTRLPDGRLGVRYTRDWVFRRGVGPEEMRRHVMAAIPPVTDGFSREEFTVLERLLQNRYMAGYTDVRDDPGETADTPIIVGG